MYINFELATKKKLNPHDIIVLQLIKQMRKESDRVNDLVNVLDDSRLDFYVEKGWVEQIKGKKSDSEIAKLRLTKSGNKLMDDIETADVTEEDIAIFDWVSKFYKGQEGKMIGNGKRTKSGIAQFRVETGISRNHLAFLFQSFISDEEQLEFSHKLENLLFSSKNLYSRKFSLDECRLYSFYIKRKEFFDKKFETIDN